MNISITQPHSVISAALSAIGILGILATGVARAENVAESCFVSKVRRQGESAEVLMHSKEGHSIYIRVSGQADDSYLLESGKLKRLNPGSVDWEFHNGPLLLQAGARADFGHQHSGCTLTALSIGGKLAVKVVSWWSISNGDRVDSGKVEEVVFATE